MRSGDVLIDSLEFARTGRQVSGQVPLSALARLADLLAREEGTLDWSLRGERRLDVQGRQRAILALTVEGSLWMTCQRCLLPLQVHLRADNHLLPLAAGEAWPDEENEDFAGLGMAGPEHDNIDPIEAAIGQSVLELVEDEVLLSLPIAPVHEMCSVPVHDNGRAAASPFAALAQLKRTH